MLAEIVARRSSLVASLLQKSRKNHVSEARQLILVPAAGRQFVYDKIPHPFRQDSDFDYLTGCSHDPDCCLLLECESRTLTRSTLYVPDSDRKQEVWDGPRLQPGESSAASLAVDSVVSIGRLASDLTDLMDKCCSHVWFDYQKSDKMNGQVHQTVMAAIESSSYLTSSCSARLESPRRALHNLRAIKSASEIDVMRQACRATAEGFNRVWREKFAHMDASILPRHESELQSELEFAVLRTLPSNRTAFPSVVGASNNATIIHYGQSSSPIRPADWILADIGCDLAGYSSDMTRSWPVDLLARKSAEYTTAYNIVLDLHSELMQMLKASIEGRKSKLSLNSLHRQMQASLLDKLVHCDLLRQSVQDLSPVVKDRLALTFCPHHVGHHLGRDVHDCALVSKDDPLQSGNVIAIEPGLYFRPIQDQTLIEHCNLPLLTRFTGIGIRIEDDIHITADVNDPLENLTSACPVNLDEIYNLMDCDLS